MRMAQRIATWLTIASICAAPALSAPQAPGKAAAQSAAAAASAPHASNTAAGEKPSAAAQAPKKSHRKLWTTIGVVGAGVATILLIHHYRCKGCANPIEPGSGNGPGLP